MTERAMTDREFEKQLRKARTRGRAAEASPLRVVAARHDTDAGLIVAEFANGFQVGFPSSALSELEGIAADVLASVEVDASGEALRWEALDVDVAVLGLLARAFGASPFFRELGRRGGQVTSVAKAEAARANGAKGGRPVSKTAGKRRKRASG